VDHSHNSVQTTGEIRLRRLSKGLNIKQAYFAIDVHVSDPDLNIETDLNMETGMLEVKTPDSSKTSHRECVSIEITAWIPEDAEFRDIRIESSSLTLRVLEDIKITADTSTFATINKQVIFRFKDSTSASQDAHITMAEGAKSKNLDVLPSQTEPGFNSRRIIVETINGSITGCFPLLDFLGLSSITGSIKVSVIPYDALPSAPLPAELKIETTDSSIQVDMPVSDTTASYSLPARNYITSIHTTTGSIRGSLILGSMSTFGTQSSSIHLTGLPILQVDSSKNNIFETKTQTGSIKVTILDPIFIKLSTVDEKPVQHPHTPYIPIGDDDPYLIIPPTMGTSLFEMDVTETEAPKPLRSLHSTHASTSSDVDVSYPATWEGNLHAGSASGSVKLSGDGLHIIDARKGYVGTEVWASKGVDGKGEGCQVDLSSLTGSVKFYVGK